MVSPDVYELRRSIRRALSPSDDIGGKSILDRVVLVAVAVSDSVEPEQLAQVLGKDTHLVSMVLDGLIESGQLGELLDPPEPEVDPMLAEWRRIEAAADCPTCHAVAPERCRSRGEKVITPHAARRRASDEQEAA